MGEICTGADIGGGLCEKGIYDGKLRGGRGKGGRLDAADGKRKEYNQDSDAGLTRTLSILGGVTKRCRARLSRTAGTIRT